MGGRTFGYFMCQTIILTRIGDYVTLIRIALVFPCVVFLISLFLPRVRWKKMAKRLSEVNGSGEPRMLLQALLFLQSVYSKEKSLFPNLLCTELSKVFRML